MERFARREQADIANLTNAIDDFDQFVENIGEVT